MFRTNFEQNSNTSSSLHSCYISSVSSIGYLHCIILENKRACCILIPERTCLHIKPIQDCVGKRQHQENMDQKGSCAQKIWNATATFTLLSYTKITIVTFYLLTPLHMCMGQRQ